MLSFFPIFATRKLEIHRLETDKQTQTVIQVSITMAFISTGI
jgi:hypothetical protein